MLIFTIREFVAGELRALAQNNQELISFCLEHELF